MTENKIIIDTVIDTEYGEKALLRSDDWTRDHVKSLPWDGSESSFEEAARDGGPYGDGSMLLEPDELEKIEAEFGETPDEDFKSFHSFDGDREVWMVSTDSLDETVRFLETLGWEVENKVAQQIEA